MLIELHAIQNFAPSNLNRDDTGAPKDCIFGGYRRARVSSQAFKRAMRTEFGKGLLPSDAIGIRTRRLIVDIAQRVTGQAPAPKAAVDAVSAVFRIGGIERPLSGNDAEKENTRILLFVSPASLDAMVQYFVERWTELTGKDKQAKDEAVVDLAEMLADSAVIPHIALFGRMIEVGDATPFGKKNLGVEAACQVAHAISTHKTDIEFDYYTAVDDLNPKEETGAGMIGTVEFNSACFYRYANVDLAQLGHNLKGDTAAVRQTVEAFVRAFVTAIPTGKQNSMAAQNPPSFVLAVARDAGNWSLANAFVRPVPQHADDLVKASIARLDTEWAGIAKMYGTRAIRGTWWCASHEVPQSIGLGDAVPDVDTLVDRVIAAAQA